MNLKLNMKEINKILAKAHIKCILILKWCKKQHIFVETNLYEAVGSLPLMPSLLPPVHVSLFFASVVSPGHTRNRLP